MRNCEFLSPGCYSVNGVAAPRGVRVMENCVHAGFVCFAILLQKPDELDGEVRLKANTLVSTASSVLFQDQSKEAMEKHKELKTLRIEASGNVIDSDYVMSFDRYVDALPGYKQLSHEETARLLKRQVAWRDRGNLYSTGSSAVYWRDDGWLAAVGPRTLAKWQQFFGVDDGTTEGRPRFVGGNLRSKLETSPQTLTPEDFRLRPDSPGYRAGNDGRDLGADVDLVGPGPAYERWKKTPEYQQWLKDTGERK